MALFVLALCPVLFFGGVYSITMYDLYQTYRAQLIIGRVMIAVAFALFFGLVIVSNI